MLYTVCPNAQSEQYEEIVNLDFSKQRQEINERYFKECKRLITAEKLKREREELMAKIKNNPDDSSLLTELSELSKKINDIR